ncbi:MAG: orotidine 5'-phosphate decarboxylase / HUMPS family protein [bacterium]
MLDSKKKYLQIAFNRSFNEVKGMVRLLPRSERIIVEAGTSFIKNYGEGGLRALKFWWGGYLVADLKCMDRGSTEVVSVAQAGASAATCSGLAPIPTIDEFIKKCQELNVDSMVDMMNVQFPFEVLQKLKTLPEVVVLHRGVDEGGNREKAIPFYDIRRIKGTYDVLISIAGGEDFKEVRRALFNDSDIAVVWRAFYAEPEKTAELANEFLKEIR